MRPPAAIQRPLLCRRSVASAVEKNMIVRRLLSRSARFDMGKSIGDPVKYYLFGGFFKRVLSASRDPRQKEALQ